MQVRANSPGFIDGKRYREGAQFDYPETLMKKKEVEQGGKKVTVRVLPKWVDSVGALPAGVVLSERKGRRVSKRTQPAAKPEAPKPEAGKDLA